MATFAMYPWCSFVFVILLQAVENKGSPKWPYGRYTLLKPSTGCPDGWDDKGYLYQDTIDKNPSNNRSETLHIDGIVDRSYVERYFCSKNDDRRQKGSKRWPKGQYCVHRYNHKRLYRMRKGSIRMYGETNNNQDNFTNFLVYIKGRERIWKPYQYTKLYFYCKTCGNKRIPISLPITKPFYLLPYGSRDCQQVKWMVTTSEWIKYHTRNYITKRGKQMDGTVPYHELGDKNHKGITMYYCYYESCNYTLNGTSGVLQSPGFPFKYPDEQLCSWRIMVPDNHTLHVHFTHFSLSANDKLRYFKRSNDSSRSWYTIRLSTVLPFTLSADSDVRFVFRSDESNTSTGFRAEYRVFIPKTTTAPTEKTTTTPITTTSSTSTTALYNRKLSTTKPLSSTLSKDTKSTKTSTSQPALQYGKSNAETMKDSPFSSRNTAIVVIVVPVVCLLIGAVLLIMIIYQFRVKRTRSHARNSAERDTEKADRSVINPTYERAISLRSPEETATAPIALNGDDDSRMYQNVSWVTPEYEDVDCERSNIANPNQSRTNSKAKKSESVKDSDHDPLYHVSELHDPKTRVVPSQLEMRESEYVKDSGPNPLYHVLEGPYPNNDLPENQLDPKSRESEDVKDSHPSHSYYHVLVKPDYKNGPNEGQSNSRLREAEYVKDSGPNPLYHVLEEPDPEYAALAEDQIYEDVD